MFVIIIVGGCKSINMVKGLKKSQQLFCKFYSAKIVIHFCVTGHNPLVMLIALDPNGRFYWMLNESSNIDVMFVFNHPMRKEKWWNCQDTGFQQCWRKPMLFVTTEQMKVLSIILFKGILYMYVAVEVAVLPVYCFLGKLGCTRLQCLHKFTRKA